MEVTIQNDRLAVGVRSLGAELTSIRGADGTEYLWQGDPAYWGGRAPVLFPIVGSLRGKTAQIGGNKTCRMERHGVARGQEFRLEEQTKDSAAFSLCANGETKERYPYDFKLTVRYRLDGNRIVNEFTVENPNREVLPFQIGGHPAFRCPLFPGEHFEDYAVEFEQEETADCPGLVPGSGLVDVENRRRILDHGKRIPLRHELFEADALIFDRLKSRRAKLFHPGTGRGIEVSFPELNYFLVWSSANGGPFVALEPWSGLATCSDEGDIFEEKRGVYLLPPGGRKTVSFDIAVL